MKVDSDGRIYLEVGDIITSGGKTATIKSIISQDTAFPYKRFGHELDTNKPYWDIEFCDTNNHYRHWKSYLDGGTIKDCNSHKVIVATKQSI